VHERVGLAVITGDEAEALHGVEELDGARRGFTGQRALNTGGTTVWTVAEATTILGYLKEARERAIDFKNMNQISVIFEIYKTKSEQFLISNGRNWRALYKSYTDSLKAKKAADAAAKAEEHTKEDDAEVVYGRPGFPRDNCQSPIYQPDAHR
jgi:hypothetical protein